MFGYTKSVIFKRSREGVIQVSPIIFGLHHIVLYRHSKIRYQSRYKAILSSLIIPIFAQSTADMHWKF